MKNKALSYFAVVILLITASCTKSNQSTVTLKPATTMHFVSQPAGESLKINDNGSNRGTFRIYCESDQKFAQVANMSLADGATGNTADYTGNAFQLWQVTAVGNGYYMLMNEGSSKYATAYYYNGAQRLIQAHADSAYTDAQLWQIISNGNGLYRIVNKATGLTVINPSAGQALYLAPYYGPGNFTEQWAYSQVQ